MVIHYDLLKCPYISGSLPHITDDPDSLKPDFYQGFQSGLFGASNCHTVHVRLSSTPLDMPCQNPGPNKIML